MQTIDDARFAYDGPTNWRSGGKQKKNLLIAHAYKYQITKNMFKFF